MKYFSQYDDLDDLDEVDWSVMPTKFWWGGDFDAQHRKNAEFLIHDFFPWDAVKAIGVLDSRMSSVVSKAVAKASHQPKVLVKPGWYY